LGLRRVRRLLGRIARLLLGIARLLLRIARLLRITRLLLGIARLLLRITRLLLGIARLRLRGIRSLRWRVRSLRGRVRSLRGRVRDLRGLRDVNRRRDHSGRGHHRLSSGHGIGGRGVMGITEEELAAPGAYRTTNERREGGISLGLNSSIYLGSLHFLSA